MLIGLFNHLNQNCSCFSAKSTNHSKICYLWLLSFQSKKPVNPHYSKSFPKYLETGQAGERKEEARPVLQG